MDRQETNDISTPTSSVGLLGEYLKQKRIDKNYTLEKLSQKTKISVNILKSLETDDYDHLPSAAYIKGFVTSYVKVLGLPLDEAINKMEYTYLNVLGKPFPALNHTKNMIAASPVTQRSQSTDEDPSPHDVIESGDSIIENTKSFLPIIIFGVIILVFVGGYKLISSVVESEVSDQKSKDLGPKIESSSALVKDSSREKESKNDFRNTQSDKTADQGSQNEAKPDENKAMPEFQRNFPPVEFKKVRESFITLKWMLRKIVTKHFFQNKLKTP